MFNFLTDKFSSIFSRISGNHTLSANNIEQALEQVNEALLEADVPYEVAKEFIVLIREKALGQQVLKSLNPSQQLIKIVDQQLKEFLGGNAPITSATVFQIPSTIMVMGLQGSGKTTTIAKIAHHLQQVAQKKGKKRSILLTSVDFYRPAAIDQLDILAKQIDVSFFRPSSLQPLAAAQEIVHYAKQGLFDHLFVDTAGRLHIDTTMLEELINLERIINPTYKLLVLDAMTGQESLRVAQAFDNVVPFSYTVLTKMDSETRGGAAFSFRYALKKSILFVGTGERVDDLEQFYPDRIANRILGMGDMLTLIEQAEQKIKDSDKEKASKAYSGKMTLQDFIDQIEMVERLGSLSKIAQYLPGMGQLKVSEETLRQGEVEMKKFKAIIRSMTPKERIFPRVLDSSRKERIAEGSGTALTDINLLLKRFEQSQQFAKLFKRGFPNL